MQGIFLAYMTGPLGHSIGIFYIGGGAIAGADIGGMKYDGTYAQNGDMLEGKIAYTVPAGVPTITGAMPSSEPRPIEMQLRLPVGFADGRFVAIETPIGPVNVRFEKIRDIGQ